MTATVQPEPRTAAQRRAGMPPRPRPEPEPRAAAPRSPRQPAAPNGELVERKLLTATRLAQILNVSETHVRRHADALGALRLPRRGSRRGGVLRFHWPTVAAILEASKAATAGEASQRSQASEQPTAPAVRRSSPPVAPGTRVRLLPDRGR
ncbi:MAG: hypothetical protein ACXVR2_18580 [Solirubrobacteraceae bacterium]